MDFLSQNKSGEEVYHSNKSFFSLKKNDIENLIELAKYTSRNRVRFCSHSSSSDNLHEMFIVHPKNAYVRPHKHLKKIESMIVLYGEVEYVVFDDEGRIENSISMGNFESTNPFYQTIREETYHSLIIKSDWLVFLEITNGPFYKKDTIFAEWSPIESELEEVKKYMNKINSEVL
jgi:cupin fold WbuC family metalloprotein